MSLKRKPATVLDQDNYKKQLESSVGNEGSGTFERASTEELAKRTIKRGKRRLPAQSEQTKVEINFDVPKTDTSALFAEQSWDSFKPAVVPEIPKNTTTTTTTTPSSSSSTSTRTTETPTKNSTVTTSKSTTTTDEGTETEEKSTEETIEKTPEKVTEKTSKTITKEKVTEDSTEKIEASKKTTTITSPSSSSSTSSSFISSFSNMKNPLTGFTSTSTSTSSSVSEFSFGKSSSTTTSIFGQSAFGNASTSSDLKSFTFGASNPPQFSFANTHTSGTGESIFGKSSGETKLTFETKSTPEKPSVTIQTEIKTGEEDEETVFHRKFVKVRSLVKKEEDKKKESDEKSDEKEESKKEKRGSGAPEYQWVECGAGPLHINVSKEDDKLSRILARVEGSGRLIFNFRIWEKFCLEKVNDNSVRLIGVASDGDSVVPKSFVIRLQSRNDVDEILRVVNELKSKADEVD